jgi:hypothetical protein
MLHQTLYRVVGAQMLLRPPFAAHIPSRRQTALRSVHKQVNDASISFLWKPVCSKHFTV